MSNFYQSSEYQDIVTDAAAQAHHDFWGAALFLAMFIGTMIWTAKTGKL